MSRRTSKEEEEKRKREQEQGARRRQTNQGGTGTKSAAVSQAATQKQTQANAQQARNRKSTDTRANAGKTTTLAKAKQAAETAAATQARNRKSTDTRANSGKSAAQTAKPKNTGTQATGSAANRKSTDTRANSGNTASGKPILRTMGRTAAKKAAEKVTSTDKGKQALETEKRMMGLLARYRFVDDMNARTAQRQSNILSNREVPGARTGAAKEILGTEDFRPQWSPYAPDSMAHPNPSGLDRIAKDLDLRDKAYGLGKDKVSMADILAAAALDPLSALKADSHSHANFGRGYGMKSKAWDSGLTDREKVKAGIGRLSDQMRQDRRQRSAANQTLSRYDKKLREQFQDEIKLAKADYDAAKARGDTAGMQAAHKRAETWRRIEGGYSGGATGMEHITPKLEQSDISTLNKTGQTQLRAAKLGYENAQTDQERSRYAAMGQDIRRNPAYLKETYDRGAYRETDANGRMRYAGTAEERAKEAEQGAAIPKAIGTGIAGAFLSLPGTTARALQTDAARNQAALQQLSDIRGGGEVRVSAPAPLTEETLGQRLLRRSDEYREKATEGQTGLNRYLTEALITGGEMIPGLAATALTGGMAAPGLAVMGAQAAGRRMGDLERQGEDPVRAFNRGLVTGLIEAGTELIPLRNLAKIARGGGGKSFARNLLTQALEEAGTEEVSEVGGYLADRAFGDPNASLTAQDLKDTAVISLLTSLGMGAGAGIVGSRRTGGTGRQPEGRTTDQAGTRNGPVRQESAAQTEDSIQAREAQLQAREKALDARAQEALEQMARSTDSDTYYNHFRNKLAQVRQEQAQVRQERVRLAETRRQAEISREEAQTRRAEEARIAEESRYRPEAAREAGAALAEDQVRRVDRTAQAARDRLNGEVRPTITALRDALRGAAEQTERLDSLQLPLAEDPERRAAQEKRLAGKPLSMKEQLMERDTGSMVKTIAGRKTRTDHAYRVVPLSQWEQEYMPSGKISRNAAEFDPNGDEHASNGGVDWYLGGYSKRYGGKNGTVVILEAPAVTSKFQTAQDNGTRMTLDPTVRHIKSSSKANPVELSELTGAWKWDKRTGEISEIDLSPWKRATRNNSLTPLEVPQRARERAQEPEGSRATSARYGQAENHIDNRQSQDLGDRRVKAFQWDHPEVKPFFRKAAAALKQQVEYADSTKTAQRASSIQRARGKKAGTVMAKNAPIRRLMDQGLSTTEIIKACDAIIHDQGQENYAAAKRVELVLDNMLSHGYLPVEMAGVWDENAIVAPNTDYLRVKETLPGAVTRGSFADYLRRNELALELGEVTEEQLRQEWEAERRVREDRESLYRSAESWGQNPRRFRSMEEELAAHAERVSEWMDEPEMQDMPEEYWERYWQQAREEERLIREKWAGREAQTPRVREYVDTETGELVRETRIPAEEAGTAPAVTEAPVRTETVREEGQKNTPREAEESTAVNTNPAQHTPEEQAVIDEYQDSADLTLRDFYLSAAKANASAPGAYDLHPVSQRMAQDVMRLVDRDITGFRTQLDAKQAWHISNDHGINGKTDHTMKDPNDVARMQYVLDNYDAVFDAGRTDAYWEHKPGTEDLQRQARVVAFAKKVNGTYFVVEAVPITKKRTVKVVTAYMLEDGKTPPGKTGKYFQAAKKEDASQLPDANAPWFTAKTDSVNTSSKASIPHTEAERNGKIDEEAENVSDQDPYSVGAAPSGFDEYSHMQNEYGTIEPGENPARMVDVPVSTNGEDRVRRGVRTIMEAQITPDEAIQAFEDEVVKGTFSYHPRKDKASVEAATKTLEDKGYWGAMEQWQDVTEGRRAAGKDDIVLAQFLYAEAARAKDIDTMRKLAAEIAAEATVAGQQVQAMRLLKKATPEGKVYYIHRLVSKMQAELEEGRGDKAPTLTIDPALEERLLDAEDEESQQEVIDEIYDQVAEQLPKTFADRLNAWRYFAMLGNPRTHIRNVVGNILVQVPLQASSKASALVQAAALPKEKRTRAVIASRAAKRLAREDYQEMKRVLSDGDKYASDESQIRRRQKLFPTPVQALMDANSKALEAEDTFFKKGTYIHDMASFITARGWDPEALTESQLEQARSHAIKEAKHATFQDASAFASWLAKQERKNKVSKIVVGGLMPFKGVPVNIAKMGFELSPAGLAKALTYDAKQVRKGEMDATDMIDHLTRGMTGTAIAGLGYFLAAQGMLTAGGGDDEKENDFEMAQGGQNYALDLGDFTYTLDWAAPSAIPLFLGAEYWNARDRMEQSGEGAEGNEDGEEDGKQFKEGLEALTRLFDPMLNMTVLSGVSDTLKTVSYSRVNAIFPMAWSIGQNYAGQVVPTLLGQIARTADGTRRTTYADRDSRVPNGVQKFVQRQENKIPGLSQRNLPWLDVWGREDREENPAVRALENFISPGYISRKNTSEMEQELKRLNDLGFEGVLPSKAKTSTKINDKYLTRDQYETLVKTQGGEARSMLEQVIGSAGYNALTDEEKAAYVKKIFDFSRQEGKLAVGMPEEKADSYVLKAREGKETLGLDPADFLALYVTKSLIDKDETEEDKTMKAIDFLLAVDARDDLTEEQKAFVKDSVKFYNMFPVSTAGFEKGVAAGLTAEESKDMLRLKKQADTDGNGSYTNAELYDVIQSTGKSEEEKAKLWEAMKPSNSNKSWGELDKENKAAEATRKQWAASVGDVSQETINSFQESVNAIGGYSSMSYTAFFDLMDSMGVPESQRSGYYAIVQSNKAHPWKKTYAQAKKYKGR